eukprot:CAMPEP_0169372536 /NCGR_PEP_ID=MMETSP1017-20121227/36512_2 /TAXON_ID=342587 /ORGANISM="Karlodinium micrum, Strain CCMP2283" /LENGTH=51 /DNA_ID=CAMNT_0009471165 /DNA_START=781 /DNA_END=932 /DNA_ORIENTATION=-
MTIIERPQGNMIIMDSSILCFQKLDCTNAARSSRQILRKKLLANFIEQRRL